MPPYLMGGVSGNKMKTRTKNILTAVLLAVVALAIYVYAVIQAVSQ